MIINAVLFPYDIQSEPLLQYSTLLENISIQALVAPVGFGLSGVPICKNDMEYTVVDDVGEVEGGDVLSLLVVESFHELDFAVIKEQIEKSAQMGWNILLARNFTNTEYNEIVNICRQHNVHISELGKEHIFDVNKDIKEISEIHTPIIAIMGSGCRCGKFELQAEICTQMLRRKYKVSAITSRKSCVFTGMHPYPDFMYDLYMDETKKIIGYNQYIKHIEEQEKPEIIIIGIPGGIMPLSAKKPESFGIYAYEILNAIKPDFMVFSLYKDDYQEEYFEEMNRLLTYRFNTPADCYFMSNTSLDKFTINTRMSIKYLQHNEEEIDAQCKTYQHKVFSKKTYSELGDFIIDVLAGYDEINIL